MFGICIQVASIFCSDDQILELSYIFPCDIVATFGTAGQFRPNFRRRMVAVVKFGSIAIMHVAMPCFASIGVNFQRSVAVVSF